MADRNDNDYLRRRLSRRVASEFYPTGGEFVVLWQLISTWVESSKLFLPTWNLGCRLSSVYQPPWRYSVFWLDSSLSRFSTALNHLQIRLFPFVSVSWVHLPDQCFELRRQWPNAVQLVNEKRLFFSCHRISHAQRTTSQFNLQFHQREQKSGESYQHAAPWKHNTSRSNRKAKVSRELHINANMQIWILSGYFLLRIHKGAGALHQWINRDYAWGLF